MEYLRLPFFSQLEDSQRVLVAGAGGGFDVFCGLPLYFGLRSAGKQVYLANLSFTQLTEETGRWLAPALVEVTADAQGWGSYFPELYLCQWFRAQGEEVSVYAFPQTGVRPLTEAYEALADALELDAVVLVDGGTDSLMRGDEAGLGTPEEDIASLLAVHSLDVKTKVLACLGFGVDHYHGVCHTHYLEAVAELIRAGAFLGAWSLTPDMPEVQRYKSATAAVHAEMSNHPSIVSSSILSAVEGQFGDFHATQRTRGSELFINPLMSLYWCFQLDPVAARLLYGDELYQTQTIYEISVYLQRFRAKRGMRGEVKPWRDIPL